MVKIVVGLGLAVWALSACSPGYVLRAAYEEARILAARSPIEKRLGDDQAPEEERRKLALVRDARAFAMTIGLEPGEAFTAYSRIDRDVLAWVLVASRRDAFQPYTWWFPIVGSVPYKGFFEKDDAIEIAELLAERGYESSIRPTDAFSTLGWFNDPVLSTTLRRDDHRLVATVIHESLHSTVWIRGHVAFNESLANFVGLQGATEFFATALTECSTNDCRVQHSRSQALAEADLVRELEIADMFEVLIEELEALYNSSRSSEEKIAMREELFERVTAPFRAKFPTFPVLQKINNADLIQLKLYLTELRLFARLFEMSGGSWETFLHHIRDIRDAVERDRATDPFELLRARAAAEHP